MKTLSEDLTEKILTELVEQKLFLQDDGSKYVAKIATGKMKAEDWRLAVEKGMDKEKAE